MPAPQYVKVHSEVIPRRTLAAAFVLCSLAAG